jgi:molybdate transport system substrate-binding protein
MPVPRLENADDLITLLLSVPTICYSRAGASGIYFESLIDRLGIGDEVRAKSLVIPAGLTAEQVQKGRAVLAIQQMSELRAVNGVRIAGPLPSDCQQRTEFSAGIFADAAEPEAARQFIAALTSAKARAAYLARGLKVRF